MLLRLHAIGTVLSGLGQRGPTILIVALIVGALSPALAGYARDFIVLSAFLLTLGSFLSAALSPSEPVQGLRRTAVVLAWVGLAVPALMAAAIFVFPVDPDLRTGIILTFLAPPVGSAAAIAAMLGLMPRLALLASMSLTVVAPAVMPLLFWALDLDAAVGVAELGTRLALIIGGAASVAVLAARWRQRISWCLPDRDAAAGIAVIGLVIVGLAMMDGVRDLWERDPAAFAAHLGLAVGLNVIAMLLGCAAFWRYGGNVAMTVALVSGNRNVTLAWAAAGPALAPAAQVFLAAAVFPILALPFAVKLAQRVRQASTPSLGRGRDLAR